MDLRQLKYFIGVTEALSFSAAARNLNVAQSALSLHVRRLEERFDVQLFIRNPRGVQLTTAGAKLLDHAQIILRQVAIAERELTMESNDPSGTITLGIASGASRVLMGPLLEDTQEKLPRITIRFVEAMTGHLSEWIETSKIQLAVSYQGLDEETSDWELAREDFYLVAPPGSFPKQSSVALSELPSYPLIVPTGTHNPTRIIGREAAKKGIILHIDFEIDSLTSILSMVAEGKGYSILAPSAFLKDWENGLVQAVPITDPQIKRAVVLKFDNSQKNDPTVLAVAKQIKATAHHLVSTGEWPQSLPLDR